MTPRIPPNEPQTEAGQALLSRLPRYGGVDVLATILAIEREAQAIPLIDSKDFRVAAMSGAIPLIDVDLLTEAMSSVEGVNWPKLWEPEAFAWVARQVAAEYARLASESSTALPPCPICGKPDLFVGTDGRLGCPHCEVAVALPVKEGEPE